jgi:hypothetical protein
MKYKNVFYGNRMTNEIKRKIMEVYFAEFKKSQVSKAENFVMLHFKEVLD